MKQQKLLERARDLIRDHRMWTTETFARTRDGIEANVMDPAAIRFCALGAVHRVTRESAMIAYPTSSRVHPLRVRLHNTAHELGYSGVGALNDSGGHLKVMELFDRAITELKNESTEAD